MWGNNSEGFPSVYLVSRNARLTVFALNAIQSAGFDVRVFERPSQLFKSLDWRSGGCVVTDTDLPEMSGLEVQLRLSGRPSRWPVVFLTQCKCTSTIVAAIRAGAVDYVVWSPRHHQSDKLSIIARKAHVPAIKLHEQLIGSIRTAMSLDAEGRRFCASTTKIYARYDRLTPREREVMHHVIHGRLNKQIAFALGTKEKTIKVHRSHVMEKMEATSLAQLVHFWYAISDLGDLAARAQVELENCIRFPAKVPLNTSVVRSAFDRIQTGFRAPVPTAKCSIHS